MSAVDAFGLLVPVTYLVMLGIETLFPAREFPPIAYWRLKGLGFLVVQGLLATLAPLLIPEPWLARHRLLNLECALGQCFCRAPRIFLQGPQQLRVGPLHFYE